LFYRECWCVVVTVAKFRIRVDRCLEFLSRGFRKPMVKVELCNSREIFDVIFELCRRGSESASCCPPMLVIFFKSNRESASASAFDFVGTHTVAKSIFLRAESRNIVWSGSIALPLIVRLFIPCTTPLLSQNIITFLFSHWSDHDANAYRIVYISFQLMCFFRCRLGIRIEKASPVWNSTPPIPFLPLASVAM